LHRVRRRLLNFLTALSLLLCVGAAVLWVRTPWVIDDARVAAVSRDGRRGQCCEAFTLRRPRSVVLVFVRFKADDDAPQPLPLEPGVFFERITGDEKRVTWAMQTVLLFYMNGHGRWGFAYVAATLGAPGYTEWMYGMAAPLWFVAAGTAVAPSAWASSRLRQRRRARRRLCPSCGYDLRATPGRCPECGWSPSDCTTACNAACSTS
jgi:hypothetical protein